MPCHYVELNSTYRNRNAYPLASEFAVCARVSAPSSDALSAADPISLAAPTSPTFTPFTPICGTVNSYTATPSQANATEGTTLSLSFPTGTASSLADYYVGAVLVNGTTAAGRILQWTYVNTVLGEDYFQVITDTAIAPGTSVCIYDPTDINALVFFLPQSNGYTAGQIVYNQTRNAWLTILSYNSTTHTATLGQPSGNYTTGTWLTTDTYVVRSAPPLQAGNSLTITSANTATIVAPAGGVPLGSFLRLLNATGQIVQITGFTAPNTVTVSPAFTTAAPAVVAYELLAFTSDSEGYLNTTGCLELQGGCYEVCLLSLILPAATLVSGTRPIFYPYFYIELRSADGQVNNKIYSNNPNAWRALFRTTVYDNPDSTINPFLRLTGDGMCQRVRFERSLYFRVFLPDGTPFETVLPETTSPAPPNPAAQISALFSFTRT